MVETFEGRFKDLRTELIRMITVLDEKTKDLATQVELTIPDSIENVKRETAAWKRMMQMLEREHHQFVVKHQADFKHLKKNIKAQKEEVSRQLAEVKDITDKFEQTKSALVGRMDEIAAEMSQFNVV